MQSLVEIGPVVLEKKILKIFNIILHFGNYLPLEKGGARPLIKFEAPPPKVALCKVLVEIVPVVLEKKIFKYFQFNFTFSLLSPFGKGRGPFFEQT